MNKRRMKKQVCVLLMISLFIGVLSGIFQNKLFRQSYYEQLAKIMGGVTNLYPEIEQKWMLAMKEADEEDTLKGKLILQSYGYTEQTIIKENTALILLISVLCSIAIMVVACFYIIKIKRYDKKRIDTLTQYLKLAEQGRSRGLLLEKEDEFSILEDEIYKTVGKLYQTREVALSEKGVLKEHIADIAHQLKTPITSMGLMCELLCEVEASEEKQNYIHQLQNQLSRADALVYSLLTLSKLEANVVQMEKKTVEVYVLVLRVLELVEPLITAKKQEIELEPEENLDIIFQGDMKWSIEALCNLVKNCIEHTPEGKKIKIKYGDTPLFTEISIEDEGEGFMKEDIPHLFKRFYKGKNASKNSVGIGLALAKTIFEKQNGLIEAENRVEGGARFRVKIYSR